MNILGISVRNYECYEHEEVIITTQNSQNPGGENIKLARLQRKLSMEQIAGRANLGRTTLWAIEKGSPG